MPGVAPAGVLAEIRHAQIAQQICRRWRAGSRPCAVHRVGASSASSGFSAPRRRTVPRGGSFSASFRACARCCGLLAEIGQGDLMRAKRPLDLQPIDDLRVPSSLWGSSSTIIGQRGRTALCRSRVSPAGSAGSVPSALSSAAAMASCISAGSAPRRTGRPAAAAEKLLQLLMADAGENRRIGYLVTVQMQNRQHRTIGDRDSETCWNATPSRAARSPLRHHRPRRRRPDPGLSNTAPKEWLRE